jgi:hypothetical protein
MTFRHELQRVAEVEGPMAQTEHALIERLVSSSSASAAPFDSLWQCSDLLIEACIYVAVAEGGYSVSKARHISQLAHRLGFSARQLSELERGVIGALADRARTISAADAL